MKKTRLLTPAQVRACATHPDMAPVEFALAYLNSRLSNPMCSRAGSPAGSPVGSFYQVTGIPIRLTKEQALELQSRCLAAKWKSVQVVVWQDSTAVSLDPVATRDWVCAYDGKRLTPVLEAA